MNRSVIGAGRPADVLTPEILEQTYGASMQVLEHGGMPVVVDSFQHRHEHMQPLSDPSVV
jgi:ABC-type cobalamin/Fe3+-siderophores transport system ATPase subunit